MTISHLSCINLPRFWGRERQEGFLKQFQSFHPKDAVAFKRIYEAAQADRQRGTRLHVLQALWESFTSLSILNLSRFNVILRARLKFAEKRGDRVEAEKIKETIADFHVASDAYINNLDLDTAINRQAQQEKPADRVKVFISYTPQGRVASEQFAEYIKPHVDTVRKRSNSREVVS